MTTLEEARQHIGKAVRWKHHKRDHLPFGTIRSVVGQYVTVVPVDDPYTSDPDTIRLVHPYRLRILGKHSNGQPFDGVLGYMPTPPKHRANEYPYAG